VGRTKDVLVQEKKMCSWIVEQRVRDTFPRPNRFVLVPDDVRGSKCGIRLFLVELRRFENSRNVEVTSSGQFARGVDDGF
jgi:uncharacterized protein YhfF